MTVRIDSSLDGIDWAPAQADLIADDFDNGRSPAALRRSFEQSQHVAIARDGDRVVGMARLLSDGVCNAYARRRLDGVVAPAAGNRDGDDAAADRCGSGPAHRAPDRRRPGALRSRVGFRPQPEFWSLVVRPVARQRREPALSLAPERARLTA